MGDRPIKKGEILTIQLDNLAYGGETVGRINNFAIFVPGGIPGEKVKIEVSEVKKRYGRGKLLEIISPSAYRINPSCNVYNECGGCQMQHVDYEEQLQLKRQLVIDAIERIGGIKGVNVLPTLASEQRFYRNKAQFPLGVKKDGRGNAEIITGFYAPGTHEIISNEYCQIQHPLINKIVRKTLQVLNDEQISIYDEIHHTGLIRHLLVRVGVCTNQAMLVFVTNGYHFPEGKNIAKRVMEEIPELVSVLQNINLQKTNVILGRETKLILGEERIIDYIGELEFEISAQSFFQVNTLQSRILYDQVIKYAGLSGHEVVLDAYCGIGTISLYLARVAGVVHGIEVIEQAIEDAERNAVLNGLENLFFYSGLVEEVLPRLTNDGVTFDVVVVDPPRKGCHENVLKVFGETQPERIVYVSCNPTTLARDLAALQEHGYQVVEVQPVDLFPHTYHVECVVGMHRKDT